jgi:hypothetical protein
MNTEETKNKENNNQANSSQENNSQEAGAKASGETSTETNSETNTATSAANSAAENKTESATTAEGTESAQAQAQTSEEEKEPVKIEFPYSELIRAKVPKAFEVVEKAATDWKNQGDFTDLGIGHPLAGIVASQALQKAKDVEKRLEEKGVISMAKMGLEIAKSQVETIKSKIKPQA